MAERFKDWKPPEMVHGEFTKWKWIPYHPENIRIGKNVDIGALTLLFGHEGIIIDDDVQIGGGCMIYSLDTERDIRGVIHIHKGVKIGANSVILPKKGVIHNIWNNIKAGSVVF